MNKHEQTEKKRIARAKRAVRTIDGQEMSLWFGLTLVYVVFVAILSGMTKEWLPATIWLGPIPLDPQYGIWILGITLWIPISLMLSAYFKRD